MSLPGWIFQSQMRQGNLSRCHDIFKRLQVVNVQGKLETAS